MRSYWNRLFHLRFVCSHCGSETRHGHALKPGIEPGRWLCKAPGEEGA